MNHQQKSERDELRARFTVWLETTVYRARLKYLEREKPKVDRLCSATSAKQTAEA